MIRPILSKDIWPEDFMDFYWLKSDLIVFCRELGISSTGSKQDITKRVYTFLKIWKVETIIRKNKLSKFDWNTEILSQKTIITDNFRNTYHVRSFMEQEIGKQYRVNIPFLKWTKENIWKTLEDAIEAWKNIIELKKKHTWEKEIGSQFEYNTYIRDFMRDNPHLWRNDAIKFWKIKREQRWNKNILGMIYSNLYVLYNYPLPHLKSHCNSR